MYIISILLFLAQSLLAYFFMLLLFPVAVFGSFVAILLYIICTIFTSTEIMKKSYPLFIEAIITTLTLPIVFICMLKENQTQRYEKMFIKKQQSNNHNDNFVEKVNRELQQELEMIDTNINHE